MLAVETVDRGRGQTWILTYLLTASGGHGDGIAGNAGVAADLARSHDLDRRRVLVVDGDDHEGVEEFAVEVGERRDQLVLVGIRGRDLIDGGGARGCSWRTRSDRL